MVGLGSAHPSWACAVPKLIDGRCGNALIDVSMRCLRQFCRFGHLGSPLREAKSSARSGQEPRSCSRAAGDPIGREGDKAKIGKGDHSPEGTV
jgi:hypothetical protein